MRDITLGSYYRADSVIHRMDARVKIVLMIVLMAAIFTASGTISYAAVFIFSAGMVTIVLSCGFTSPSGMLPFFTTLPSTRYA